MRNIYRTLTNALIFGGALSAIVALSPDANAEPRTHDGFYLHLDAGLGYLSTSAESRGSEVNFSGVTLPSALMLGGTVGPVAIGGGFFGDYAFSPSMEINGVESELEDVSLMLVGIGVFADYYVDPHGGLHFQPFVGWGGLSFSSDGNSGGSDPTGLVLALGAGYDWWVADEWSIGVMGRIAYAPLSLNDVSYTTIAPALLATFTYH
jgi:hypothetical protein